mmetsp:Transcript_41316/g.124692  ORF Transcript_41316/g.124692 Transcript_41316/m.124692 type:complete len:298 (+) Transcript_41316:4553-5446(+)
MKVIALTTAFIAGGTEDSADLISCSDASELGKRFTAFSTSSSASPTFLETISIVFLASCCCSKSLRAFTLASRCLASMSFSSAAARLLLSSASCCFFVHNCLLALISLAKLAWTLRTRGDNLLRAITARGADFRASMMSAANFLLASDAVFNCPWRSSSTSLRLSSVISPSNIPRPVSSTWLVSCSNKITRSVALCTRSLASAWVAVEESFASSSFSHFADGGASFGGPGEAFGEGLAGARFVSTTRSPCTSPSQGIRHPVLGGKAASTSHRLQTSEPPTWPPNHQPEKLGPSRVSQ